jgi:hypothetical protein
MRALSIQVQPHRSAGIDVERISDALGEIAAMADLVQHHQFNHGHDKVAYLNFTFGASDAASLWRVIRERLYEDEQLGPHMKAASMAMCSSESGWDDYLQLYHFDPAVALDSDQALAEMQGDRDDS